MSEKLQRERWIDIAKTIGIYLVILGHMNISNDYIVSFIYAFHMPLFFFISGYLTKTKKVKFKDFLMKQFKRIMIPYFTFYCITYIYWLYHTYLKYPEIYSRNIKSWLVKPFIGMLYGNGYNTSFSIMSNVVLWFLPCIFMMSIIFYFINYISKDKNTGIIGMSIILIIFEMLYSKLTKIHLLWSIESVCLGILYFSIGYILKRRNTFSKINTTKWIVIFFVTLLCTIIITSINGRADINGLMYGKNIVLMYIGGFCGILLVIAICKLTQKLFLKKEKLIIYVSQNTLVIMAIHSVFINTLEEIFKHNEKYILIQYTFISLTVLFLSLIVAYIVNRYMPFVIGKRKDKENVLQQNTYCIEK